MQGLEESKDLHYILDLLGPELRGTIRDFIVTTLTSTTNMIEYVISAIQTQQEQNKGSNLFAEVSSFKQKLINFLKTSFRSLDQNAHKHINK